ncbi:MAG TPA: tetratricopeptide repeat protein [Anaerolineales bacterium]|nr:tetratricopeptide repeat protein [Anaerolineales bacterium]
MKLSVFQGGFTRELAERVANANLEMLSTLIMKSLVHLIGEGRYDLHEAVRQYGLIQLKLANMAEQTRAAHLETFMHLAETIEPELTHGEQYRWLAYLETELDNFRAALRWAFDSGNTASILRLTGALWRFWHMRSYFVEGSQWLEKTLQMTEVGINPALRAKVLNGAGLLAYYQNHFDQAKSRLEECLALQSHLNERDIAYAEMTLAYVVHDQFDFNCASLLYMKALERFRRLDDSYGIIRTLNGQGALAFDIGDLDTAASLFRECLALARECKDRENMALAITNLGWTAAIRGDETAIGLCQEAMMLFHEQGNKLGVAFCLEGIGAGFTLASQPERAVHLFGAASAIRKMIAALPGGTHGRHVESILQRVRSTLPKETFAPCWAEGEAMSLEQAIELALTI